MQHTFLAALTALGLYALGIGWMTQQVSYPLFSHVPEGQFVAYHRNYSRRIPIVIIVPGFTYFLASMAFVALRPDPVPLWLAAVVGLGGLASLVATVGFAIPCHQRLQREGSSPTVLRRLRNADRVRAYGATINAVLLLWAVTLAFQPVVSSG